MKHTINNHHKTQTNKISYNNNNKTYEITFCTLDPTRRGLGIKSNTFNYNQKNHK